MSRSSVLQQVFFENEASWGENVTTYANAIACVDPVDVSGLEWSKIDSARTTAYQSDYTMPIRGVIGGSFTTKHWLPGHGSTTAGAISAEEHETLLGYVAGNLTSTGTGTTCSGAGTATVIATTAADGFTAGGIIFAGTKNDGHGDAQAGVVVSHAANVLTLLNQLPGSPDAPDVIASSFMVHPTETPSSASVTSTRWRFLTANRCYEAHGCFPTSFSIDGASPGELPTVTITWGVSWWQDVAPTFPSSTTPDTFNPAPSTAGSLFLQNHATATRATYAIRSFRITVDLAMQPVMAPGGIHANQAITGAVRGKQSVAVEMTVDAGNASTSPTWPVNWDSDEQYYHLLYTVNGAASGKRLAIYLPRACLVGVRPHQRNDGGINRETLMFRGRTGTTTTSELTLSAWRLALG